MPSCTLHVNPSNPLYFREAAVICCVAFAGDAMDLWTSSNPDTPVPEKAEDLPVRRLSKQIRDVKHHQLEPNIITVMATLEDHVAGLAVWRVLGRQETFLQWMYRKVVGFYDAWQDWLFPRTWVKKDRIKLERRLGVENIKKYVEQDTWVLEKFAVHPQYQKEGVGTALLT